MPTIFGNEIVYLVTISDQILNSPGNGVQNYGPGSKKLVSLPNEVLLKILRALLDFDFDDYDYYALTNYGLADVACAALSCKHFARLAIQHSLLSYKFSEKPGPKVIGNLFKRLRTGWVPYNQRWCSHCGKFRSREPSYWTTFMARKAGRFGGTVDKRAGYQLGTWGMRLEHLVKDWCFKDFNPKHLRLCPYCEIMR